MRLGLALLACHLGCGRIAFDAIAPNAEIEPPMLAWSLPLGGPAAQAPNAIAATGADGFAVGGYTSAAIDLGGGVLPYVGLTDAFVASFTADGVHRWSRVFGSAADDDVYDIAVDGAGNVYVTGRVGGPTDFGGGMRNAGGGEDVFVASYTPDGAHRWSRMLGGPQDGDFGFGIATDAAGDVYVTGWFTSTADFGDAVRTATSGQDIYLLVLDANGNTRWSRTFGGLDLDQGQKIAVGTDVIALGGIFLNTTELGNGVVTSAGSHDALVLATDLSGTALWSRTAGSVNSDQANGIAIGHEREVYACGGFADTLDFGGVPATASGTTAGFVSRFDPDGTPRWTRAFGGSGADEIQHCIVDSAGTVVAGGLLRSPSVVFDDTVVTNAGNTDLFLIGVAGDGALAWVRAFGSSGPETVRDLAAGPDGVLYAAGAFAAAIDFGDGVRDPDGADVFVLRFVPP